jgi:type VI secretion system protein ImpE
MNASDLYKAGKLAEAIDAQIKEVKANPADQARRLFLFELLVFSGDIERARKQIDAIKYEQIDLEHALNSYRQLLLAEDARRRLFGSLEAPKFFGAPPEHLRLRLDAVQRLRDGQGAEAAKLLAEAAQACPPVKGKLNDKPFTELRDCDDLFASVLEVMANGSYYWVALEQIESVTMNPPRFPRDLIWIPAHLELTDESAGNVFLPALYPRSDEHADPQVKLGRMTDWKEIENGPVLGAGLHQFLAGEDAIGVLEWRKLELEPG